MKNFTIAKKLTILATISFIFLIIVSGIAVIEMKQAQNRFNEVQHTVIPSIVLLSEANSQAAAIRSAVRDYIIGGFIHDQTLQETQKANLENLKMKVNANLDKYQANFVRDAKDKEMLGNDHLALDAYLMEVIDVFTKVDAENIDGISQQFSDSGKFRVTAMALIKSLSDHAIENQKYADKLREEGNSEYNRGFTLLVITGIVALVFLVLFSYLMISSIVKSLRSISDSMNQIEGNLDFTVVAEIKNNDEISKVATSLNNLVSRIRGSLKMILENADKVSTSAEHLSQSSTEVADAAAHQSDAASNMAASVEEMAVSISHVSDRSDEALKLSTESGKNAIDGEQVITQTVNDINKIADSVKEAAIKIEALEKNSEKISTVVNVIKDVAEQTNLLALNAAIEAARAGDMGRGFAVVADEVRKLAERTSISTKEISAMIDSIRSVTTEVASGMHETVDLVKDGVNRAEDANRAIAKISEASKQTGFIVDEISSAIHEQNQASSSIAVSVEGIAQMAEESSAAAGHTATAASELLNVSISLNEIVKQYKI